MFDIAIFGVEGRKGGENGPICCRRRRGALLSRVWARNDELCQPFFFCNQFFNLVGTNFASAPKTSLILTNPFSMSLLLTLILVAVILMKLWERLET